MRGGGTAYDGSHGHRRLRAVAWHLRSAPPWNAAAAADASLRPPGLVSSEPVSITKIKALRVNPYMNLLVVKVETS
eukprot:SAG31_NODE_31952_length_362_cov_0.593156_1_plen_75_part_01